MSIDLRQHTRLVVLVGVLVLALFAGGLMLVMRPHASSDATSVAPVTPSPPKAHVTPTQAPTPTHAVKPAHHAVKPAHHAVKPAHHAVKPRPVVRHHPIRSTDGLPPLPVDVASALAAGQVVVVALWAPNVKLDDEAVREAEAGANDAGAAFAVVDVTTSHIDGLSARFSVLHDPGVLVLSPPADLVVHIDGFADRNTVEQAAATATP